MRRLGSWPGHMALGHVEGLKPKQEIKDAEGEAFLLSPQSENMRYAVQSARPSVILGTEMRTRLTE